MYRSLLNHPELTRHVSDLGTFLRFGAGVLPAAWRELTILWVARRLGAAYEWVKHVGPARQAGVPDPVIEALRTRKEPNLDAAQAAVLTVARCVLERRLHSGGGPGRPGGGDRPAGGDRTGGLSGLLSDDCRGDLRL